MSKDISKQEEDNIDRAMVKLGERVTNIVNETLKDIPINCTISVLLDIVANIFVTINEHDEDRLEEYMRNIDLNTYVKELCKIQL